MCWKALHGQVSFIRTECSRVRRNARCVENTGIACKLEAGSRHQICTAGQPHPQPQPLEGEMATLIANSQWLVSSWGGDGMAGLEGDRKLTWTVVNARRVCWEFLNKPAGNLCLVKSQLENICLAVCLAQLPRWGWGDSVENIDSGHPFSGWQNNWRFHKKLSCWSFSEGSWVPH